MAHLGLRFGLDSPWEHAIVQKNKACQGVADLHKEKSPRSIKVVDSLQRPTPLNPASPASTETSSRHAHEQTPEAALETRPATKKRSNRIHSDGKTSTCEERFQQASRQFFEVRPTPSR